MRPGNPAKSRQHCLESTSPRPGTASIASSLSPASLGKEVEYSEKSASADITDLDLDPNSFSLHIFW
jgi:hypothetical protein